jgi:hypothetical protein
VKDRRHVIWDDRSGSAPELPETDELLAMLAAMPRCADTAEVIDAVLDYRRSLTGGES